MERMQELVRQPALERQYALKRVLETHGIEAEVWHDGTWGPRARARSGGPRELRLMVRERDVVRARWVLYAAGVDVWPDENDAGGQGATLAG
jgi:hypothetical protein